MKLFALHLEDAAEPRDNLWLGGETGAVDMFTVAISVGLLALSHLQDISSPFSAQALDAWLGMSPHYGPHRVAALEAALETLAASGHVHMACTM